VPWGAAAHEFAVCCSQSVEDCVVEFLVVGDEVKFIRVYYMEVSKKYQVVIPEKLRKRAGIKPGDKMVAITKHGIIQHIPICPINETKGFIKGLNIEELRGESEQIS
jgi:AbrB family looped-hinge helix DNA binding protein